MITLWSGGVFQIVDVWQINPNEQHYKLIKQVSFTHHQSRSKPNCVSQEVGEFENMIWKYLLK